MPPASTPMLPPAAETNPNTPMALLVAAVARDPFGAAARVAISVRQAARERVI
jgi:hypothetical protein